MTTGEVVLLLAVLFIVAGIMRRVEKIEERMRTPEKRTEAIGFKETK
jgi:hypothetical protein